MFQWQYNIIPPKNKPVQEKRNNHARCTIHHYLDAGEATQGCVCGGEGLREHFGGVLCQIEE